MCTTGVMMIRDTWLVEDQPIDPEREALEARWDTGIEERVSILAELGYLVDDPEVGRPEDLADAELSDYIQEWSPNILLHGDWLKVADDGSYIPDITGRFAAVERPDDGTLQVVWSDWCMRCRPCSPCYPGQGDLDSPDPEGGLLAYAIPPNDCLSTWAPKAHIVLNREVLDA